MQAYPGQGNPVLRALKGKISVRQLRVMIENLPPDNAVERHLRGHHWGDGHNLMWDVSTQLRTLVALYINAHLEKGKPRQNVDPVPHPDYTAETDTRSEYQKKAERDHLQAVLHRGDPR